MALKLKESYYSTIEKEISNYFFETFFVPLSALLQFDVKYNSIDIVVNAINKGSLIFEKNTFKGTYNARISRELSKFAEFDGRSNTWTVKDITKVPSIVKSSALIANDRFNIIQDDIKRFLDNLDNRFESGIDPVVDLSIKPVINEINNELIKDFKDLTVLPELSKGSIEKLAQDYTNNQDLSIKKWDFEQVTRLRNIIEGKVKTGYNKLDLIKMIEEEWEVSRNKAKFLARQETSLFLSKFRRERSLEAGVQRYKWSTSHDERVRTRHKHLDGKIFFYGSPPIVDLKTGRREEPGEDYNCRCVAIPIL